MPQTADRKRSYQRHYMRVRRLTAQGVPQAVAEQMADRRQRIIDQAQARMLTATPQLVDSMIDRGLGTGRDAQRAGERLLEQVGVLQREPTAQDSSLVALRAMLELAREDRQRRQGAVPGVVVTNKERAREGLTDTAGPQPDPGGYRQRPVESQAVDTVVDDNDVT